METELSINAKINAKVSKVLNKLMDPNFKISSDVYLNLFLVHLVGKCDETKNEIQEEYKEQLTLWLIEAIALWDKKQFRPPSIIQSFTLSLASKLSVDEQVFVKLNSQNIYESLVGIAQDNVYKEASVTLGLITLLCSFLEHKSGVQWVLATTYWADVMNLGRQAHTMYIRKKAYQFIATLLEKTICFNRNFCCSLVAMLNKPLEISINSLPSSETVQTTLIENRTLFETLRPHLVFISEVLEILSKRAQCDVLEIFLVLKTAELTKKLLMLSQIEDFSFELIKIHCVLLFSKLKKKGCTNQRAVTQVTQDSITLYDIKILFDIIQDEMDKDHVKCVIKICHYAHMLYCNMADGMPLCIRKGEPIEFQNQMLLFQIAPTLLFLSIKQEISIMELLSDVFRREFFQKLVKMSAIRTLEICFKWKERLDLKPDLIDDMTFGLQYMLKSKRFLNKERAAIFFQPLVYFLKDTLMLMEKKKYIEINRSSITFLYTLIETIIDLVQSFDLTWRDSIETISVMSIACEFLQYTHWEQKIVIAGLRLLNLAISKYMSPDMVLLMDNSQDSLVSHTGSLLYAKCHDVSWEVRDTALENVYTLSLNANSKFPSYTNVLLEAKLPQLVLQMALKDGEYYVRVTAFKCLTELIQIEEVWNVFNESDTFLTSILDVFENETEGIVRKEAATLIQRIHRFQSFPDWMLPSVYDIMTHAAVGDLHWEVKCNALDFWINVFKIHLQNQGMIDHAFPAVTFSREQRKIVTLTEPEVRKRIIRVLNQVSHIGGLYVLKCACLDDCDVEVSRKAIEAASNLLRILKMYKVPCENVDMNESPFNEGSVQGFCMPSPGSSTTSTATSTDCADTPGFQFPLSPFDTFSPLSVPLSPLNLGIDSPSPLSGLTISSADADSKNLSELDNSSAKSENQDKSANAELAERSAEGDQLDKTLESATTSFDAIGAESILDELLSSNDMAFLQKIYNPSDQVKNTTSEMKKRTYLAPSEFVKFIYQEVEKSATEKTQWPDEFESLLDDILKEYNIVPDVNNMDCY